MIALEVVGATAFTAALYWACILLQRRFRLALLHPVLVAVLVGGTLFALLPPRWLDAYLEGSAPITWLLGPATAALALPFFRRRAFLAAHPWTALLTVVAGCASTVGVVWAVGALLGLSPALRWAATLKSVTLPVALGLAEVVRTQPGVTTLCVFASGLLGAAVGPALLSWARVHSPVARGLALGTLSHVLGTARVLEEDALSGAAGVVALTLSAVLLAAGALALSVAMG